MAVKAKSGKARAKSGKAKSKPIGRYSHRTAWLNKVLFQEGFWTMEEKQFSISKYLQWSNSSRHKHIHTTQGC